ncbi:phage portal protein [Crossiella sp. CA-258035]|uniref:phage portal protein n=1 Tax=Crossiella sp. CA-258035 TaxID=2981138 RepID=UPI0024BD0234|nr:phage portal protein [Crossiella sp. CA-258035]WHT21013.1 phage portal protein [Crossiella sp. CA-258035]
MKLSDLSDEQWFARLNARRRGKLDDLKLKWQYYNGEQPLTYVAKILAEQEDRFPACRVNWPALVVDSLEERLDVEGFRLGDDIDDELTAFWQDNDLDEESTQGHITSLVTSESYVMVGPGEGGSPLITVEYPEEVAVEIDPRTRKIIALLKVYKEDQEAKSENRAVLLVPGRVIEFENGKPVSSKGQTWAKALERHQTSPLVPAVKLTNRPIRGVGRSELDSIIPLADAVNQTATNMMAGIEHHSVGRRWAVGVSKSDFVDKDGKQLSPWEIATGPVWAVPGPEDPTDGHEVKLGQFAASDLRNFHESIKQLASLAASLYGLPPHYMGYASDNPASADAIRSSEARLVKRAERRQRAFGGSWEKVMRLALAVVGRDPAEANRLETVWRDASTPTRAAMTDAAVKAFQAGYIDAEQAQEDSGYSQAQRRRMAGRTAAGGAVRAAADAIRNLDVTGGSDASAGGGSAGS